MGFRGFPLAAALAAVLVSSVVAATDEAKCLSEKILNLKN